MEPREGQYEFGWLDDAIEALTRGDRWFILGTPSAAQPAWLSKAYPETLRTGDDRVRRLHGNRVNYNLASPVYRAKTRAIARELALRYGAHPRLLAWHMSNEYNGADYGPESVAMFRDWLRQKFGGDIGALNHAYWTGFWSHTYSDFEEIDPPGFPYGDTSMAALEVDWRRFVTDQTIDFMNNEAAPLRELSPNVPITTNLMGTYPGLDYRQFVPHIDFVSWDSYPANDRRHDDPDTWVTISFKHDLMRSLKPDRPWLLMECTPSSGNWFQYMTLKRPGGHRFESLHAIAHGSDGVQYFQWRQSRGGQEQLHGSVVGQSGDVETRTFNEVQEVSLELAALKNVAGSTFDSQVALLFDWENMWALEAASGPTTGDKGYEGTCIEHYRAFWSAGISVDLVGQDDDLSRYRLLVAPMAFSVRPGFRDRVAEFVRNGGTFVTTYLSAWVDENSLIFDGGAVSTFREILGIRSEEFDAVPPGRINMVDVLPENELDFRGRFAARDFFELVACETAHPLATFTRDFYAGHPALTVNRLGRGEAYYVASRNERRFLEEFLPLVADRAGVMSALDVELPEGVTVQRRVFGDEEYVFAMNANSYPVRLASREYGEISLRARDVRMLSSAVELSKGAATRAHSS
jgi:beta-galactosidase